MLDWREGDAGNTQQFINLLHSRHITIPVTSCGDAFSTPKDEKAACCCQKEDLLKYYLCQSKIHSFPKWTCKRRQTRFQCKHIISSFQTSFNFPIQFVYDDAQIEKNDTWLLELQQLSVQWFVKMYWKLKRGLGSTILAIEPWNRAWDKGWSWWHLIRLVRRIKSCPMPKKCLIGKRFSIQLRHFIDGIKQQWKSCFHKKLFFLLSCFIWKLEIIINGCQRIHCKYVLSKLYNSKWDASCCF